MQIYNIFITVFLKLLPDTFQLKYNTAANNKGISMRCITDLLRNKSMRFVTLSVQCLDSAANRWMFDERQRFFVCTQSSHKNWHWLGCTWKFVWVFARESQAWASGEIKVELYHLLSSHKKCRSCYSVTVRGCDCVCASEWVCMPK